MNKNTKNILSLDDKINTIKAKQEMFIEEQIQRKDEVPVIVTLQVSECSEFPNFGEFHDGIETVEEAMSIFHQISPHRMNGIRGIGICIHVEGTESWEDTKIDILTEHIIDLEILDYIPEITKNDKAMSLIEDLLKQNPQATIRGSLEKWRKQEIGRNKGR